MRSARKLTLRAFTLLELLVVIAIIGILASMVFPVTATMIERANSTKCMNNLKQLGIAAHAAANDNENRFPLIEIDPQNPIYAPEDGAKSLPEAFQQYGIGAANLQCPSDLKGPNWFAKVGASYMWQPFSEDEPTAAITIYTRRGQFPGRQSRVRLATDYERVHLADALGMPRKMNTVYADGHVVSR